MVGLTALADRKIATLSGGQRRRLDVAIGVVGRPELLFLDEPTAGFDPEARRDFHELVLRLSHLEDTTILLTTHDLTEAEKLADRILILAGGRIVADGSPVDLAAEMATEAQVRWRRDGSAFAESTTDATAFVRTLLADGGEVTDLEVRRASLEDTYLAIVRRHETRAWRPRPPRRPGPGREPPSARRARRCRARLDRVRAERAQHPGPGLLRLHRPARARLPVRQPRRPGRGHVAAATRRSRCRASSARW